jgi:hypothetical protein
MTRNAAEFIAGADKVAEIRHALRTLGAVWVRVSGPCMSPTLMENQMVYVRRTDRLRVGDIALLDASGWLEIHRLVDRIQAGPKAWYVHLGDASFTPGLASSKDLIGVIDASGPRRSPARRARLWGLALRLGVLLWYLGLMSLSSAPVLRLSRRVKSALLGIL